VELKKGELKVYYLVNGRIDSKLDEAIEEVLKKFGYHRWASGSDFETKVRDLAFDKKS